MKHVNVKKEVIETENLGSMTRRMKELRFWRLKFKYRNKFNMYEEQSNSKIPVLSVLYRSNTLSCQCDVI